MSSPQILASWLMLLMAGPLFAQSKPVRARLPTAESLKSELFFDDAFTEGLRGSRPAILGQTSPSKSSAVGTKNTNTANPQAQWSSFVSARTLEDRVKALQIQLQTTITSPAKFRGGGYLVARRMFTELATLFAVIHQYDREVRWKQDAARARDLFLRAAANTKTTSIQTFNEAKKRKLDLEELVQGARLSGEAKPSEESNWSLINRAALMQRFTISYEEGMAKWASSQTNFEKHKLELEREAELLMMLSRVLVQDGMEDGNDEDYAAYSNQLEKAAREVQQSVLDNDYQALRKATSDVGQACVACHEDYRG